jgi:hypothetical protein
MKLAKVGHAALEAYRKMARAASSGIQKDVHTHLLFSGMIALYDEDAYKALRAYFDEDSHHDFVELIGNLDGETPEPAALCVSAVCMNHLISYVNHYVQKKWPHPISLDWMIKTKPIDFKSILESDTSMQNWMAGFEKDLTMMLPHRGAYSGESPLLLENREDIPFSILNCSFEEEKIKMSIPRMFDSVLVGEQPWAWPDPVKNNDGDRVAVKVLKLDSALYFFEMVFYQMNFISPRSLVDPRSINFEKLDFQPYQISELEALEIFCKYINFGAETEIDMKEFFESHTRQIQSCEAQEKARN